MATKNTEGTKSKPRKSTRGTPKTPAPDKAGTSVPETPETANPPKVIIPDPPDPASASSESSDSDVPPAEIVDEEPNTDHVQAEEPAPIPEPVQASTLTPISEPAPAAVPTPQKPKRELPREIAETVVKCTRCLKEGFAGDTAKDPQTGEEYLDFRNEPLSPNSTQKPKVICNACEALNLEELHKKFSFWYNDKRPHLPAVGVTYMKMAEVAEVRNAENRKREVERVRHEEAEKELREKAEKERKEAEAKADEFIKEKGITPDPNVKCAFPGCNCQGHGRKKLDTGRDGKPFYKVMRFFVKGEPQTEKELQESTVCQFHMGQGIELAKERGVFIRFMTYDEAREVIAKRRDENLKVANFFDQDLSAEKHQPRSQRRGGSRDDQRGNGTYGR